jgi:hypothetical protein
MKKTLTGTVVDNRPGYVDEYGQTFAAPKSTKRIDRWKERLQSRGYIFR